MQNNHHLIRFFTELTNPFISLIHNVPTYTILYTDSHLYNNTFQQYIIILYKILMQAINANLFNPLQHNIINNNHHRHSIRYKMYINIIEHLTIGK